MHLLTEKKRRNYTSSRAPIFKYQVMKRQQENNYNNKTKKGKIKKRKTSH